ncbi:hypothetical protein AB0D74_49155 [Streptomyces sp. NPDC048278]|uniref:hypothetical protein n=1 Tax=Streptomyces sp. NPDC048278 TaxID=3155809 RepID=UPI00342A3D24
MTDSKLTLEQEVAAATAIIQVGLERLKAAATDTEAIAPHVTVLRALYDHSNTDAGVLGQVSGLLRAIGNSLAEVEHEDVDEITEVLDEAQGYVEDRTGEEINRALELLTPLLACEGCNQQKDDVQVMKDPFTTSLYPERDDHPVMTLCHDCAVSRFEDS